MVVFDALDRPIADVRDAAAFASPLDADGSLTQRLGLALNSTLDLTALLGVLSEITLEFSGSDSCGILLLRGDGLLHPTVGIGAQPDEDRWERFLAMDPIELDEVQWDILRSGRTVAFEDARSSPLLPSAWLDTFDVRALALVPLIAAGEPCGLLTADWRTVRRFEARELRVLEAIASHASVAVANARLFGMVQRRAQLQTALAKAAAALATPSEPDAIASRLMSGYADLLGARLCVVGVLDDKGRKVRALAAQGTRPLDRPVELGDVPHDLITRVWDAWESSKHALDVGYDEWLDALLDGSAVGADWYLLIPLQVSAETRGIVVLGFPRATSLDREERLAAEALADIAAAALERHALLGRLNSQVRQLDALQHISAALEEGADARRLVDDLNAVLANHDIVVEGLTFRDRLLARHLGGDEPRAEERASWKKGQRPVRLPDGALSVPLRVGKRVVGMLRVRAPELTLNQRAFLDALARGLAEVAFRGVLRAEVEQADRQRAVTAERDRMADDLHDTAGQVFVAIGLLARRQATFAGEDSPAYAGLVRLAELADGGRWEIEQAVRALSFVPDTVRGLVPSIKALARSVQTDSGIAVGVVVRGQPTDLSSTAARALYRIFHQALANAWRHAKCHRVTAVLDFEDEHDVTLLVRDDGIGLDFEEPDETTFRGLAGMRRAVAEVGGSITIATAVPSGALVKACVPSDTR